MDEGESLHTTREGFAHLSDVGWGMVGRMSSTVEDIGVTAMLESRDRDQQHASIARFIHYELATKPEIVALLHQQGS